MTMIVTSRDNESYCFQRVYLSVSVLPASFADMSCGVDYGPLRRPNAWLQFF